MPGVKRKTTTTHRRKSAPAADSQSIQWGYHSRMPRRASLLLLLLAVLGACSAPPPPIQVGDGMVTVLNQTDQDWTDVLITVNDHFRGFFPSLKAEGRANAPLNQLTTGFGQRWVGGTPVRTVDVMAKGADGNAVKLSWGRDQDAR